MEPILIFLLVAVVVIGLVATTTLRRRSGGVDLEPSAPASAPPTPPPEAPAAEAPVEAAPTDELVAEVEEALAPVRPRFRDRLGKARDLLGGYVTSILGRSVDAQTYEELEEALIRADVGVETATRLVQDLRTRATEAGTTDPAELIDMLKADLIALLSGRDRSLVRTAPDGAMPVWLFVGVNGVGKTTSIGKVAARHGAEGSQVMLAAGDTFRAAAAEQLGMWAERTGAEIVRGREGSDPASVIFDAISAAASRGHDLVLADTAGRLHTKTNLMDELSKVRRVADREPGRVVETLLVLDATTGQNGMVQAREFTGATHVTGVVLTKLDGTAKGGIALAIELGLGIPVKLVGLGETADDLVDFDPTEFVDALFATD